MKLCVITLTLLSIACAQAPITDKVVAMPDLQACQSLAERYSLMPRAGERAAIESARAAGVAGAISELTRALGASLNVWLIALGYMTTGAASGLIEGQDRRAGIIRECLRDKGYLVY